MPAWVTSVLFATLVATVPMTWVLRIMRDLPDPLLASRRRWAPWANSLLIGVVTVCVTVFIRFAYYGFPRDSVQIGFQFVIACLIYVFGMVLLVRQFEGLYPEYFVTTGRSGLGIRKAVYNNIVDVETLGESGSETVLRIEMNSGQFLRMHLPTSRVAFLFEVIERNKPEL